MPYIKGQDVRRALITKEMMPITPGELNFLITKLCHDYVGLNGLRYATLNAVIGVLESAKLEFNRTVVSPYEDKKRLHNGSVSELDAIQLNDVR